MSERRIGKPQAASRSLELEGQPDSRAKIRSLRTGILGKLRVSLPICTNSTTSLVQVHCQGDSEPYMLHPCAHLFFATKHPTLTGKHVATRDSSATGATGGRGGGTGWTAGDGEEADHEPPRKRTPTRARRPVASPGRRGFLEIGSRVKARIGYS